MSTKPFKDIEKMMMDAAEGFEMPYEEESWEKMEHLLDRNPVRMRPVFWLWWLLPIVLGVSLVGYFTFREPNNTEKRTAEILPKEKILPDQAAAGRPTGKNDETELFQPDPKGIPGAEQLNKVDQRPPSSQSSNSSLVRPGPPVSEERFARKTKIRGNTHASRRITSTGSEAAADAEPANSALAKSTVLQPVENSPSTATSGNDEKMSNKKIEKPALKTSEEKVQAKDIVKEPVEVSKENIKKEHPIPKAKEEKNTAHSRWYFILAAGAEGSSPKLFAVDKLALRKGANIGYQFNKHLSLQSGLFIGSKKYIAGPNDYKAKAGTYWSTVQIVEVDANCLVLEIPLDVRYSFKSSGFTSFYGTAGLSSYIMTKEDYDYLYNRYGYAHNAQASYKGNEHLFSVLRLGAGVETIMSNTLSLNAAPSVNIPLAGVGEGSVKLYSLDLMVGLKYQPLRKTKKK